MPDSEIVPTPAPSDLPTFTILVEGKAFDYNVLRVIVDHEINRIPSATIILIDGNPAKQDFPESSSGNWDPGKEVEIKFGYHGNETTVFKGVFVAHKIQANSYRSNLRVEAKDKAFKMAQVQKDALFTKMKDSDIISKLCSSYGVGASADSTSVKHEQMVQFQCSDWEFLLNRAQANARLVIVKDGDLKAKKPKSSSPALDLSYGSEIIDLELEVDARWQEKDVEANTWNYSDQKITSGKSSEPSLPEEGDLSASKLAGLGANETQILNHMGKVEEPVLKSWAEGELLKSRLGKIRGRVQCQGFAKINPGDTLKLTGLGKHFNGNAYVTAVRQDFSDDNWHTDIQVGLDPNWFAPAFAADRDLKKTLIPGMKGLCLGTVLKISKDPQNEARVKVHLPMLLKEGEGVWARVSTLFAGKDNASFFRPDISDEVVVGFPGDDPNNPIMLGMLNSSGKLPPPLTPDDDKNDLKGFYTRDKLKLTFHDKDKVITMITPAENSMTISDKDKSIVLKDQTGNVIKMEPGGITLETPKEMNLKSKGKMNLETQSNMTLKAMGKILLDTKSDMTLKALGKMELNTLSDMTLKSIGKMDLDTKNNLSLKSLLQMSAEATLDCSVKGLSVKIEGNAEFSAKGNAMAKLESSGMTEVKGTLVKIN